METIIVATLILAGAVGLVGVAMWIVSPRMDVAERWDHYCEPQ